MDGSMHTQPYGTWASPLSAQNVASAIIGFQDIVVDSQDIYWSEMRPQEKGRYVIVKKSPQAEAVDILPAPWNARTRVHEYGGAAFTVHQGIIYFSHYVDQRIYQFTPGQTPKPLTPEGIRFAECQVTQWGMLAIGESDAGTGEPENFLALINLQTGTVKKLHTGFDFYAAPAISADGTQLAWIAWNHPNMPWDNTTLWVADILENNLSHIRQIDAQVTQQSFYQPQWHPKENILYVVSDKSNWWNLYQVEGQALNPVFTIESEIGTAMWTFGRSSWAFYEDGILCYFPDATGKNQLHLLKNNHTIQYALPYTSYSQIRIIKNPSEKSEKIVCIAGASDKPTAIIAFTPDKPVEILRENTALQFDTAYLSKAQHITFPSKNNRQAHAYYYAPANKDYQDAPGKLPPLIVKSHGGPTANCGCDLNLEIQYWTSRGYAFVDVNYGGSTGYGRKYRHSLNKNWGIVDVEDCEAAAQYLVSQHKAAPDKLAITGGSAGGYTTLAALTFTQTFHVGASHYGVSDCGALATDTHKFESRYLDNLIGPYPQEKALYEARSPIFHVEKLTSPIIFFQGKEDKIVPPDQAEKMYTALQTKGISTALFLFDGEQHGFRNAENRITVLIEQEKFFRAVLKLDQKD